MKTPTEITAILTDIAHKELGIETLLPRGRDHHDFHDVGVVGLSHALELAFVAGVESVAGNASADAAKASMAMTTTTTAAHKARRIGHEAGLVHDEHMFLQTAAAAMLAAAATGALDLNQLAREELASRGCDATGKWVGFKRA